MISRVESAVWYRRACVAWQQVVGEPYGDDLREPAGPREESDRQDYPVQSGVADTFYVSVNGLTVSPELSRDEADALAKSINNESSTSTSTSTSTALVRPTEIHRIPTS